MMEQKKNVKKNKSKTNNNDTSAIRVKEPNVQPYPAINEHTYRRTYVRTNEAVEQMLAFKWKLQNVFLNAWNYHKAGTSQPVKQPTKLNWTEPYDHTGRQTYSIKAEWQTSKLAGRHSGCFIIFT